MKIFLAALLVSSSINAQEPKGINAEADALRCAEAEAKIVDENKASLDKLYSSSMDSYNGGQPCIGIWAVNVKGAGASVCTTSGSHFEVGEVQAGSSAELAGLRQGDVLLSVAGNPIRFQLDFELAVLSALPGSNLNVEVKQDASTKSTLVRVGLMYIKPGSSMLCQFSQ
jgi:C-terminal processing protease CtpA/Prc